jgi:hypothetical protein
MSIATTCSLLRTKGVRMGDFVTRLPTALACVSTADTTNMNNTL